ncbi:TRI12-domain-containing protein [Lizonia empirigonia]|nr:TRI12-domain-containing protein [Lizonia empirigonia]
MEHQTEAPSKEYAVAEHTEKIWPEDSERVPEALGRNLDTLPLSYFYSPKFLGSFTACGFSFMAAVGSYAMVVSCLPYIVADIGPSDNSVWVALANQLAGCVMYLLVGRLSDIFGRFFITGSLLGLIGSIVGATATNVNTLIGAQVFTGLAAGFQLSSFWVLSELVPIKYRLAAVSTCYIFSIPSGSFGAKIALSFQNETNAHWRGVYYFLIGVNAISTLCWYFFYHPPTYKMLHRRTAAKDLLLHFDWVGLVLFTGSLFTFLMGLSWGGSVYPWKSGRVIGTVVVCAWIAAIGSAVYYAYALIWPTWVAVMLSERSWQYRATITCLTSLGITAGQIIGGYIATFTGPKYGAIIFMYTSVPVLAAAAYNPLNISLTMALITTGCLLNGMMETIVINASTFPLKTQEEIGTAGGLAGSIRSFGSTIATTILSTTLTTRLAASNAGLPATSIPSLISGLGGSIPLTKNTIPGLTSQTVFLANIAFGSIGLILVWLVLNKDPATEEYVAAHLHHVKDEEALENSQK